MANIVPLFMRYSRHVMVRTAGTNLGMIIAATLGGVIVARVLGPDGRGNYAAIMAVFGIAQVLGELGQSASVTYHVSKYKSHGSEFVASSRVIMLGMGAVVTFVGLVFSGLLAQGDVQLLWAYRVAFISCLINSLCAPYMYSVQAVSIGHWNGLRILQPGVYLLLIIGAFLAGLLNILVLTLLLALSLLVQATTAYRMSARFGFSRGQPSRKKISRLASYGVAQTASAIPTALNAHADKIILSRLVSPYQLGQYAVAASVISVAAPFSTAIGSVLFPRLAASGNSHKDVSGVAFRALILSFTVTSIVVLPLCVLGDWIIPIVFGPEFQPAARLLWWLAPAAVFRGLALVCGDLLRGRGAPSRVALAQVLGLGTLLLTLFLLTPRFGLLGTATAVSLGQFVAFAFSLVALLRHGEGKTANSIVQDTSD